MAVRFELPMSSVPITTDVVSSSLYHGEANVQHYVIKFVSDLLHVGGFLCDLRFPQLINLTATITEILLNTIKQTNKSIDSLTLLFLD